MRKRNDLVNKHDLDATVPVLMLVYRIVEYIMYIITDTYVTLAARPLCCTAVLLSIELTSHPGAVRYRR
jgi:hypothetical protein